MERISAERSALDGSGKCNAFLSDYWSGFGIYFLNSLENYYVEREKSLDSWPVHTFLYFTWRLVFVL